MFEEEIDEGRAVVLVNPGLGDTPEGPLMDKVVSEVERRRKGGDDTLFEHLFIVPPEALVDVEDNLMEDNARLVMVVEKIHDEEGDLDTISVMDRMRKADEELAERLEIVAIAADAKVVEGGMQAKSVEGDDLTAPVMTLHKIKGAGDAAA
jgi:hypothetical protein